MGTASIELVKEFKWKNMEGPASFQQKLDGVPTRIMRTDGKAVPLTRQNEVLRSIPHITAYAEKMIYEGGSIVGELHIDGMPFKDISGHVRAHTKNEQLKLHIFDGDVSPDSGLDYETRRAQIARLLEKLADYCGMSLADLPIQMIPHHVVYTEAEALESFDQLMLAQPNAEGAVLHSMTKKFQPGKRGWGTQRIKPVPTIDLKVVGFVEAVSGATGEGIQQIGRIEVEFTRLHNGKPRTAVIGVGPGSLTHLERAMIFRRPSSYIGKIAEVKYMRDDTYEALRQPTFLRWRDDKTEGQTA